MSPVPTEPGWWWRANYHGDPEAHDIVRLRDGGPLYVRRPQGGFVPLTDDDCWLAPVASPEEVEGLRQQIKDLNDELERVAVHLEQMNASIDSRSDD